jgi:hypothetical protein
MMIRSMRKAAGVSLFAAVLAVGATLPERPAAAQVTTVPRVGVAFTQTITRLVTIESVDPESGTVAFRLPDGQFVVCPVTSSLNGMLATLPDGASANITYNQVVTLLNLRQKGPGSREARREQMSPPDATDIQTGRFTMTVVGVDLASNTVSVIDGRGGPVQTYRADTIARQDMLRKIKVGDVVIGLTTPLMITAISPVK